MTGRKFHNSLFFLLVIFLFSACEAKIKTHLEGVSRQEINAVDKSIFEEFNGGIPYATPINIQKKPSERAVLLIDDEYKSYKIDGLMMSYWGFSNKHSAFIFRWHWLVSGFGQSTMENNLYRLDSVAINQSGEVESIVLAAMASSEIITPNKIRIFAESGKINLNRSNNSANARMVFRVDVVEMIVRSISEHVDINQFN